MKVKKESKINALRILLKTGSYTIDELIEKSKCAKTTVEGYVRWGFKRQGYIVEKIEKEGKLAYTLKV